MKTPTQANPNQRLTRSLSLPIIRLRGSITHIGSPVESAARVSVAAAVSNTSTPAARPPSRIAPAPANRADGSNSGRLSIGEILDDSSREAHWRRVLQHSLLLLATLGLGACASFSVPMTSTELAAESASCARSALCRTFIEDRPPVLALAVNDAKLCEVNAQTAETILTREGIETRRYTVRLKPNTSKGFSTDAAQSQLLHTFVAARVNTRWYAVDNGALPFCDRVCRLSEALHGVEFVSSSDQPRVSVDQPLVSSR
ncbi:MAG: hypothetical protein AB7V26_03800 [Lysobacterales bacterium]